MRTTQPFRVALLLFLTSLLLSVVLLSVVATASLAVEPPAETRGWLHWRGPNQNGTAVEKNLPEQWALPGAYASSPI